MFNYRITVKNHLFSLLAKDSRRSITIFLHFKRENAFKQKIEADDKRKNHIKQYTTMGYESEYYLVIMTNHNISDELKDDLECDEWEKDEDCNEKGWDKHGKFYDFEKDMLKISQKYPTITFRVERNGEERGDHWLHFFKNNKSYVINMVKNYPSFNEKKLK